MTKNTLCRNSLATGKNRQRSGNDAVRNKSTTDKRKEYEIKYPTLFKLYKHNVNVKTGLSPQ